MTDKAELFRYQRLFGSTDDGLQVKVTIITASDGRVKSASIQMRAVDGPVPLTANPSLWSIPFTLSPMQIGETFDGGAA